LSDLGVHGSRDAWQAMGSPTTLDYARQKVQEILATQRSLPLDHDVAAALTALQKRADSATT
jgi:trimethylamine:corrinoid methyltransferase-like protein